MRVDKVFRMVNHEVGVADTVQVEVRRKFVRNYQRSRFDELLYQSGFQGFSCSVGYSDCKSSASASFDHAENPGASTNPPAVVLVFVAKHGFVDFYSFASAAQFYVTV